VVGGSDRDADPSGRERRSGIVWLGMVGVAAVAVLLLLSIGTVVPGPGTQTGVSSVIPLGEPLGFGSTTDAAVTRATVQPDAGAAGLLGAVAVTPWPSGYGSSLWVLEAGGRLNSRDDVPLIPGDFDHPMLFTAGRIVFTDLTHAYLLDAALGDPVETVADVSFVVPGATPGQVWMAGRGAAWVAPLDVASGTVGVRIVAGDLFWWLVAGVGDGLIVSPVDEATFGRTAYWSPTEGLSPIDLPTGGTRYVVGAAGNLLAVASHGVIDLHDVAADRHLSSIAVDLGDGDPAGVCISPDQQLLAVTGTTGEAAVVDTQSGDIVHHLSGVQPSNGLGWTSANQLVYITNGETDLEIHLLDVTGSTRNRIAALEGASGWWLTASGAMC